MTTTQTETKSSLEVEINRFVKFVFISALIMGFMVFLIGCIMTKFEDILGLFSSGFLVVIVANVPQGIVSENILFHFDYQEIPCL